MRSTRRRTHRSDANSAAIVQAARKLGITVVHIGRPVDLLVGIGDRWWPVELKSSLTAAYTKDQDEFRALCEDKRLPMLTWRSIADLLTQLGAKA